MSFAIFTDTSANLPTPWLRAEGIGVLPFHYSFNNRDYACLDTEAFDDAAYYAAIGKGVKVSTAQVTPQQYMDAFEPVLAAGRDLLFVGM
ncbi:MAG: DegV family protein, partial [bacterium]